MTTADEFKTRHSQIVELVDSYKAQERAHEKKKAVIAAQEKALHEWAEHTGPLLASGYAKLSWAMAEKNEALALKLIDVLDDAASIALSIPLHLSAGQTISFADFTERVFGKFGSLHILVKHMPSDAVPDSVLEIDENTVAAPDRCPVTDSLTAPEEEVPGMWGNEKRKKKQEGDIADLQRKMAVSKIEWDNEINAATRRLKEKAESTKEGLKRVVVAHACLTEALESPESTAPAIKALLKKMEGTGTLKTALAWNASPVTADEKPFTEQALDSGMAPEEKFAVYAQFVALGCPPLENKILDMALEKNSSLPAGALQSALEKIYMRQGNTVEDFKKLLLETPEGKTSLIERALESEMALQAILDFFPAGVPRTGFLLQAAKAATTDAARSRFSALVTEELGPYIRLTENTVINSEKIGVAYGSETAPGLHYIGADKEQTINPEASSADILAIMDTLESRPGYVRLGEYAVLNTNMVSHVWVTDDGANQRLQITLPGAACAIPLSAEQSGEVMKKIDLLPGWVKCGETLVNTRRVEDIWAAQMDAIGGVAIKTLAHGENMTIDCSQQQAMGFLEEVCAQNRDYVAQGGEILNSRRLDRIYYDETDRSKPWLTFLAGASKDRLGGHLTRYEAERFVGSLIQEHGFVEYAKVSAINPANIQLLMAQKQDTLTVTMNGEQEVLSDGGKGQRTAENIAQKIARAEPDFVELRRGESAWLRASALDHIRYDESKQEASLSFSGKSWTVAGITALDAADLMQTLQYSHGFLPIDGKTLLSPRTPDALAYEEGRGLRWSCDGGHSWWNRDMHEEDARRLITQISGAQSGSQNPLPREPGPGEADRPPTPARRRRDDALSGLAEEFRKATQGTNQTDSTEGPQKPAPSSRSSSSWSSQISKGCWK